MTKIGIGAFHDCCLTSIKIPNSVTEIGGGAFIRCTGLTSVEIPNSVMEMGLCVFRGCASLKHFRTHKENPDDTKSILMVPNMEYFDDAVLKFSDVTLFVPVGTGYAYRHHEFFKNFKEILATSK